MKILLLITLLAIGVECSAEVVEESDFLQIEFVLLGCESNIVQTEFSEVGGQEPLGTLSFLEIDPVGKTELDLKLQILNQFQTIQNRVHFPMGRLETINIKTLKSSPGNISKLPTVIDRPRESQDDELCWELMDPREKVRRIELAPKVSLAKLYNKAFKCVPPAKLPPPDACCARAA